MDMQIQSGNNKPHEASLLIPKEVDIDDDTTKDTCLSIILKICLGIIFLGFCVFLLYVAFAPARDEVVTNSGLMQLYTVDSVKYPYAVCNDGSPAVFWYRMAPSSAKQTKWLIHVNGGGNCYDANTCNQRWIDENVHMTSNGASLERQNSGIYSDDSTISPQFYNYNAINILYCSSDLWTGNSSQTESGTDFQFRGAPIMEAIWDILVTDSMFKFQDATEVYIAGRTAGGVGVLANYITTLDTVSVIAPSAKVRGVVDCGWYVDMDPFVTIDCTDPAASCPLSTQIQIAQTMWRPVLPDACINVYGGADFWKCYYGLYTYPLVPSSSPIFFNEFLNNDLQLSFLGDSFPESSEEVAYAVTVGDRLLEEFALSGVNGYYSAACINHGTITGNEWIWVEIDGINLPNSIITWNDQVLETNTLSYINYYDNCTGLIPPLYCGYNCPPVY